jgi:hypothetical protein
MTDAKTLLLEFLAAVTRGQNAAAQALLPGGVKDLPDLAKVIFSVPPDYRS